MTSAIAKKVKQVVDMVDKAADKVVTEVKESGKKKDGAISVRVGAAYLRRCDKCTVKCSVMKGTYKNDTTKTDKYQTKTVIGCIPRSQPRVFVIQ